MGWGQGSQRARGGPGVQGSDGGPGGWQLRAGVTGSKVRRGDWWVEAAQGVKVGVKGHGWGLASEGEGRSGDNGGREDECSEVMR